MLLADQKAVTGEKSWAWITDFLSIDDHFININLVRASDISRGRGPAKFRFFREIPRNSPKNAKSARNISKYLSAKHI